jgi:hypothetical protein
LIFPHLSRRWYCSFSKNTKKQKNQNLQKKESWGTNFEARTTFYL